MIYALLGVITLLTLALLFAPLWRSRAFSHVQKVRLMVGISLFIAIVSAGLYAITGSPDIPQRMAEREDQLRGLAWHIGQLSEVVKQNPKDLKSWVELGDALLQAEQYSTSATAYKQAVLLSGGNVRLIVQLARTQILAAGGQLTPEARQGLEVALSLEPDNAEAKKLLSIGERD